VQEKLEALNKIKAGDDMEAIKKATEELSASAQKIGEALYKQQVTATDAGQASDKQQGKAEEPKTTDGEADKKPEEAEFEEVNK